MQMKNSIDKVCYREYIIPLLMGMIVFSPLSSFITINLFHFPISAPEILFIPFIPYFYRAFYPRTINIKLLVSLILVWCAVLAISLIANDYTIIEIIGCARTYLYIILFFAVFTSKHTISFYLMALVAYGGILGWGLDVFLRFFTMSTDDKIIIGYGPMIAIPIAITYPAVNNQRKLAFLLFLFCICIGIFGALRRVIFITTIVYLVVIVYVSLRNPKVRLKLFSLGCITISALILAYPFIKETIHNYSWDLYVRIILKSEDFFNGGGNSGDEGRTNAIAEYFNNFNEYIIPNGFVSKQYNTTGEGIYNDFPLTEISHTFGILISVCFILYFSIQSILLLKKIRNYSCSESYLIFPIGFLTICILLFMEGSFLTFPYQSIYTGYLLSGLVKRHHTSII